MKEQFVTYEIALALKELGFDEECFAIFYQEKFMNGHIEPYVWNLVNSIKTNSDCNSIDIVTAPLWQQVIDWFRIKYNWLIVVDVANSNEYYAAIREYDEIGAIISKIPYKIYSIYEEAREHAILKAIELIKK